MAGDANYSKLSLLLHGNGTNGSTTFTDSSPRPKTPTVYGDAKISTAQSVFGGASMLFDGNGDYLAYADHEDFELGSGDFTLGMFLRLNGWPNSNAGDYGSTLVGKDNSSSRGWNIGIGGTASSYTTVTFTAYNSSGVAAAVSVSKSFSLNTWCYVEIDRSGNLLYISVDGVILNAGGTAFTTVIRDTTSPLTVGALMYDATYKYFVNAYIDELFLLKGAAEHTANFTPPTSARLDYAGQVASKIYNDAGAPTSRLVRLLRRDTGAIVGSATSDPSTGDYSINCNTTDELNRIVYDDVAGTLYNDKIDRVFPA